MTNLNRACYARLATPRSADKPSYNPRYTYQRLNLEPSPPPPLELHDYSNAWIGLALLLATALLAFGAGWVARAVQP